MSDPFRGERIGGVRADFLFRSCLADRACWGGILALKPTHYKTLPAYLLLTEALFGTLWLWLCTIVHAGTVCLLLSNKLIFNFGQIIMFDVRLSLTFHSDSIPHDGLV